MILGSIEGGGGKWNQEMLFMYSLKKPGEGRKVRLWPHILCSASNIRLKCVRSGKPRGHTYKGLLDIHVLHLDNFSQSVSVNTSKPFLYNFTCNSLL